MLWVIFAPLSMTHCLFAQTMVGTGSIVGTVSDPSGAVIAGARVRITNTDTGQVYRVSTNSAGAYNSGALLPGNYRIQVGTEGFISIEAAAFVQIGVTTAVSVRDRKSVV